MLPVLEVLMEASRSLPQEPLVLTAMLGQQLVVLFQRAWKMTLI